MSTSRLLALLGAACGCSLPAAPDSPDGGRFDERALSVGREMVDLGCTSVGRIEVEQVRVENRLDVEVGPVLTPFAGEVPPELRRAEDGCAGVKLGPHQSCQITLAFAPQRPMQLMARLDLNAFPYPFLRVPVLARADHPARLRVSPAVHDFGAVALGAVSAPVVIAFTNGADTPVQLAAALEGSPDFETIEDGCTMQAVAPGGSCALTVRFAPKSTGPQSARATFKVPRRCLEIEPAALSGTAE
jgi:hypothetical protein